MADSPASSAPPVGGGAKGNKFTQFIRKNKTLTIVGMVGGIYYLIKHSNSSSEEPEGDITAAQYSEAGATPLNELGAVNSREEYNEANREIEEREREQRERLREEERELEERERERKEESKGNEKEPEESPGSGNTGEPPTSEHGISIHGRDFPGATSSRIARSGQTDGNKSYIEYVITFPGRQERWQYFPATGNWRKVSGAAGHPAPGGGGGSGGSPKPPKPKPPIGIGPGHPAPGGGGGGGGGIDGHPNAVKTENRCVSGGVGKHTAPAGYHLFCASDGFIWRAPNGG